MFVSSLDSELSVHLEFFLFISDDSSLLSWRDGRLGEDLVDVFGGFVDGGLDSFGG